MGKTDKREFNMLTSGKKVQNDKDEFSSYLCYFPRFNSEVKM